MTGCPAVERTLIADETAAAEGASEYVSDASTLTEAAAIALLSARNPRFPKASPCLTIVTACQPNSEIAAATARATTSSGGATRSNERHVAASPASAAALSEALAAIPISGKPAAPSADAASASEEAGEGPTAANGLSRVTAAQMAASCASAGAHAPACAALMTTYGAFAFAFARAALATAIAAAAAPGSCAAAADAPLSPHVCGSETRSAA